MTDTPLMRVLRVLLPSVFPREPFAYLRRYRVIRMRPSVASAEMNRIELQIVKKATGFDDVLLVQPWPGLAGSSSQLTPGCHVLIAFIDGDREQPIVTHFSTPDDNAWKPVSLRLDATSIKLGSGSPPAAARVGDVVDCGSLVYVGPGSLVWTHPDPTTVPPTQTGTIAIEGIVASGSAKVSIE